VWFYFILRRNCLGSEYWVVNLSWLVKKALTYT